MPRKNPPVPHPGSACCDLSQDLAGWISRERAYVDRQRRWARALSSRGKRLHREATAALVAGDSDWGRGLDNLSRAAFSQANARAQSILIREGHLDRVERAHAFRLSP